MKILKTEFHKNVLDYRLLKRAGKIALFQFSTSSEPDGYEVYSIYIMRPHIAFGHYFEESEEITGNNQFLSDDSGFFGVKNRLALRYRL
jgi:hypothetical protein